MINKLPISVAIIGFISCNPKENVADNKQLIKPKIIYFLVDDLGFNDLECFGQKIMKTLYIDKLASEGIHFRSHHAGSPVCTPSRFVLMTGLYTGHTTFRGNDGRCLSTSYTIVAALLQKTGYYTVTIGKWGLGEMDTTGNPLNQGFDDYFGLPYSNDMWPANSPDAGERYSVLDRNRLQTDSILSLASRKHEVLMNGRREAGYSEEEKFVEY